MSALTDLIQSYKSGKSTLAELADTVADFPFETQERYQDEPTDPASYYAHTNSLTFGDADTWDELDLAEMTGLLTPGEYDFIDHVVAQKHSL